jgi:hypothetical protein
VELVVRQGRGVGCLRRLAHEVAELQPLPLPLLRGEQERGRVGVPAERALGVVKRSFYNTLMRRGLVGQFVVRGVGVAQRPDAGPAEVGEREGVVADHVEVLAETRLRRSTSEGGSGMAASLGGAAARRRRTWHRPCRAKTWAARSRSGASRARDCSASSADGSSLSCRSVSAGPLARSHLSPARQLRAGGRASGWRPQRRSRGASGAGGGRQDAERPRAAVGPCRPSSGPGPSRPGQQFAADVGSGDLRAAVQKARQGAHRGQRGLGLGGSAERDDLGEDLQERH